MTVLTFAPNNVDYYVHADNHNDDGDDEDNNDNDNNNDDGHDSGDDGRNSGDEDERDDESQRNEDGDFEDENAISVCCTWGPEMADGILTYSIENDADPEKKDAVMRAVNAWNIELDGIQLLESDDDEDIEISFRGDGENIAGKTVNYFDGYGLIRESRVTISEEFYDIDFNPAQIEQITKHEIGHVLGLGHANFNGNLMTEKVSTGSGTISPCEVNAVKVANAWKTEGNGNSIELPKERYVRCQ
ncbi:MAG: matrixin family metalloprotease [Thermoproteota archaeon]|nr:matrixin family metalloprotease [Thermoproteota archaeon]